MKIIVVCGNCTMG